MKGKLKELIELYGSTALICYLVIFIVSMVGFYIIIQAGVDLNSYSFFSGKLASTGTIVLAWAATKVIQPFRIALTFLITPIVAKRRTANNEQKGLPNE